MSREPERPVPTEPDATDVDLDAALARAPSSPALRDCLVRSAALPEPRPIEVQTAASAALADPIGSPALASLAQRASSAAIITSDATRGVPNRELLPPLLDELARGGIDAARVTVVFGGGAHRPVTAEEVAAMLGDDLAARLSWVSHDAKKSACVSVGTTSRGNEILVNRVVAEADLIIALGVCEAHEFAGYTGGRKAILPAVAGYDAILRNHGIELISHPCARPGVLEGNPVHEEMLEAAGLAGLRFIVNVALDGALRPVELAAGEPEAAHAALVERIAETRTLELAGADLIVTGPGRPLDVNLYQSIKPLVALEPIVDRHTVVVLLSGCSEGVGSEEMLLPFDGADGPDEVVRRVLRDYTVEKDHSYFVARFLARCPNVVAWCPGVSDRDLARFGFEPARDLEDALGRARRQVPADVARPEVLLFARPQRALLSPVRNAAGEGSD